MSFSKLERFIDQKLKELLSSVARDMKSILIPEQATKPISLITFCSSDVQVRLAFSVSIYANREILLMDEVLAVGDSNFQNKCPIVISGIIPKLCGRLVLV